ncbi:MAG: c-type cytochrome [Elusimicrobia bacterium]|nr:c-type cytochrome [Elusimicrobiota bacterium]
MSYRKLFYVLNFLLLGVFVWAVVKDNDAEWKTYQRTYYEKMATYLDAQAGQQKDPAQAAKLRAQADEYRRHPLAIKQIITDGLGRYDRCITCHVGMDEYENPGMTTPFKTQPYAGHPDIAGLVKAHPFEKFGCTVCHEGQGLATTVADAHGWVTNWDRPMLTGVHIQGSCVKCHGDFRTLKGAEAAAKGYDLFHQHGCLGCHSIDGVGGTISVDLGDIADKPIPRIAPYNFLRVTIDGKHLEEKDWKIQNWILGHLVDDPEYVTPNDPFAEDNAEPIAPSPMPDFSKELTRDQADDIVAYLMGMTKVEEDEIPYRYHVAAPPEKEPRFASAKAHGKYVFEKYGCAGCHGVDAVAGRRRFNALGPGQKDYDPKMTKAELFAEMEKGREPTLPDLMSGYDHDELVAKIEQGVPPTAAKKWDPNGPLPVVYMPAWKGKISKKELDDLATWLLSTAKQQNLGF